MPTFQYEVRDARGGEISDTLQFQGGWAGQTRLRDDHWFCA